MVQVEGVPCDGLLDRLDAASPTEGTRLLRPYRADGDEDPALRSIEFPVHPVPGRRFMLLSWLACSVILILSFWLLVAAAAEGFDVLETADSLRWRDAPSVIGMAAIALCAAALWLVSGWAYALERNEAEELVLEPGGILRVTLGRGNGRFSIDPRRRLRILSPGCAAGLLEPRYRGILVICGRHLIVVTGRTRGLQHLPAVERHFRGIAGGR